MDELIQKIVGLVADNDGSIDWNDLKNGLEYQEQRIMPNAIRQAESQGLVKRSLVAPVGERPKLTVDAVGGE